MPGGKGKSIGGKAGSKDSAGKTQKSHSAKAGLQVSRCLCWFIFIRLSRRPVLLSSSRDTIQLFYPLSFIS